MQQCARGAGEQRTNVGNARNRRECFVVINALLQMKTFNDCAHLLLTIALDLKDKIQGHRLDARRQVRGVDLLTQRLVLHMRLELGVESGDPGGAVGSGDRSGNSCRAIVENSVVDTFGSVYDRVV